MRVLFIGGTGKISSACTQLAVDRGIDLYLLNRGQTSRPVPANVNILNGDIRDPASARAALGDLTFDAVVNWIAFTPEHIEADLALFRGRTKQYVFISSASAYQKPLSGLPITESTPLANPYWLYSRNKIACEEMLHRAPIATTASPSPSSARRTPTTAPCCPSTAATPSSTGCARANPSSSKATAPRCGR